MAEIALKVGDTGNYKDGMVVDAFNDERIHKVSSQLSKWPNGQKDLKEFLFITVDDFTNEKKNEILSSVLDKNGEIVSIRKYMVNWKVLSLAFTIGKIENKTMETECRGPVFILDNILTTVI